MRAFTLWLLFTLVGVAHIGISFAEDQQNDSEFSADPELVERGRYIALVAGCNDCHTPGYAANNGNVPETLWLTGDTFGWRGPWGTTYGTNLRLLADSLSEAQWVDLSQTLERRPPMPWFNLNAMHADDLRALYHFIRSLGDPGQPAPAALHPDEEPTTPYARWTEGAGPR